MSWVAEALSFVSFMSDVSVGAGFEKDSRAGKTVFMSKALRGGRQKDISGLLSVFFKSRAMTGFRHKRHKRQYLMSFLVFSLQGRITKKSSLQKSAILEVNA